MNQELETKLKRINPISKLKIFTGDTKLYTIKEYNNQIKEVDVYTQEQMIEFAKFVSGYTAEYVSQELDEDCFDMNGHGIGTYYSAENVISKLFEDDNKKEFDESDSKLTLEDFLGKDRA